MRGEVLYDLWEMSAAEALHVIGAQRTPCQEFVGFCRRDASIEQDLALLLRRFLVEAGPVLIEQSVELLLIRVESIGVRH